MSFEPEDAGWYFGRERLVAELLATTGTTRCTGVVGESGSGKSSLARAGLLAALGEDGLPGSAQWPRLLVAPGTDPMAAFASALAPLAHATSADHVRDRLLDDPESISGFLARAVDGTDATVMIVVDQLEEVFTACGDEQLRARFLDVLARAVSDPGSPARLLAAVRSDYYGRCAEHAAFAEVLGEATVLVAPMRPDELQRAIEGPAARAGLTVETELVERIFDDVGAEPGYLPLLETALLETWNRRRGQTMTLEGYEAAGGVRGAVAHLADDVYERMSTSERAITRAVFLRLAEPGQGSDDVRRRAPLDELLTDDAHAAVVSTLVESRLVVTGDATAEVAHEALLREWPRLRGWLEEDREGRRVQSRVATGAREWAAGERDEDLLFRGSRLAAALDVADEHPETINPVERDFLAASRAREDSELRAAHRTTRRFRRLTVALATLLVVAIVAVAASLVERSRADDNASRARSQATISDAALLASRVRSLADERLDLALLLGVEARRLHTSVETEGALETALLAAPPGIEHLVALDSPAAPYPAMSPDGTVLAAAGEDGIVRLLDADTGRVIRRLGGPRIDGPVAPQFDAVGSRVAVGSASGAVTVWDVASGRRVGRPLPAAADGPAYGAFDPTDGNRLFVAAYDGTVTRWELAPPRPPRSVELFKSSVNQITLNARRLPAVLGVSPDGRRAFVGDFGEGSTTVWDLDGGAQLAELEGGPGSWDASGRTVTTTWRDQVRVWDAASGQLLSARVVANASPLTALSPDGTRVAVRDARTQRIRVLDVASGADVVEPITLHTSEPLARFLPDGRLFTASAQRVVVFRLDATPVAPIATVLEGERDAGGRAGFTSDGRKVVTVGDSTRVWNASDGLLVDELVDPVDAAGDVFPSPDLRRSAILEPNGTIRLWDLQQDEPAAVLPREEDRLTSVDWSPDGSKLVVGYAESALLWRVADPAHPRRIARLVPSAAVDEPPYRTSVAFSPDGRRVVIVREGFGTATVFDTSNGRILRVLASTGTMSQAAFSPDSRTLAAALTEPNGTGSVLFFDVETGGDRDPLRLPFGAKGVAFSRDGRRFVTLRVDRGSTATTAGAGSLQLWDTATRSAEGEPLELPTGVVDVQASADGSRVVHRTDAGYSVVWDLSPERWQALACRIAGRQLTRDEWDRYLPGRSYDPGCSANGS